MLIAALIALLAVFAAGFAVGVVMIGGALDAVLNSEGWWG